MKRHRWLLVWLIQIAAMLAAGCLAALALWLNRTLYGACMWGVMPLLGLASACMATRRGLLNYAAWLAPPIGQALGHLIVWYYLPDAGPVLLCAFVSLVGAAAGEVLRRAPKKDK